jgi:hypothetical protein
MGAWSAAAPLNRRPLAAEPINSGRTVAELDHDPWLVQGEPW